MRIVAYESDDRDDEKKCDSEVSQSLSNPVPNSHLPLIYTTINRYIDNIENESARSEEKRMNRMS